MKVRVHCSSQHQRAHSIKRSVVLLGFISMLLSSMPAFAQGGEHTLYGDVTVDESKVSGLKPLTFDVILYSESGILLARQTTANNGRYRFNNLITGVYLVAIEVENSEIARISVDLRSPILKEVRRDLSLEWRLPGRSTKAGLVSVGDTYVRSAANQKLFQIASQAKARNEYAKAADLFQQIIHADPRDFQAWCELANVHFLQKNVTDAENEYLRAIDAHPKFFLALLNLGRLELSQKRYDVAIEVLRQAVTTMPSSADANYFLGEAYLQNKKGSSAVVYFNEALRLEPREMAEVHLRLALLYNRAGLKQKAAAEYKQFLTKRPNYPERKKLERYIAANKEAETSTKP
jgi:tetratricopeptide (TPR) repeat protein